MQKKYVVACEHHLIGVFYLKQDGQYCGTIEDALKISYGDAIRTVRWFNYLYRYEDDVNYYCVEVPFEG